MSSRSAQRWFITLAGCLLFLPLPALAQTSEPHDSDSVDPGSQAPSDSASKPDLERTAEMIVTLTNQFRSQHERGKLKVNKQLARAAQDFADYIAKTDTFSHTADGKRPSQRVGEHGYQSCLVAENIAWEYNSSGYTAPALARAFVAGWRHSPGHRKNMLDGDLDEIGVGVARSAKTGRYYAVQDFGRPKSKAIAFKITNESDATMHYRMDGQSFSIDPRYTMTHQRCRAGELDFQEAHGKGDAAKDGDGSFRPRNGQRFVIRGSRDGGYTVEVQ